MSKETTERWLSVAEIAEHLGVKPTSIYSIKMTCGRSGK